MAGEEKIKEQAGEAPEKRDTNEVCRQAGYQAAEECEQRYDLKQAQDLYSDLLSTPYQE